MTDRFPILPGTIGPLGPKPAAPARSRQPQGPSFDQVLQQQLRPAGKVRFSRHAEERMQSRGIAFSPQQLGRLEQAVAKAEAKGGRDSLVLLDDAALVVSVKNSTVVTVADKDGLKQNLFTNIDSAIIA